VADVTKQKSAFHDTWFSKKHVQKSVGQMGSSHSSSLLCTLSSNISAPRQKNAQDVGCSVPDILLQNSLYKNTLGEMGLLTIALCTLSSSISAHIQKISKKMPSMLGYIVPDDPMQNSSFHDTWLYKKNV